MKTIPELALGYADAENYKKRENKKMFSRIFLRTPELDRLCEQDVYFLIGEKGTGKTAYAVFLSNMDYKDNVAAIRYIRETEYKKFVFLKKEKHLSLSDYTSIWKVILCLLLAQHIREKEKESLLGKFRRFGSLSRAIDEYYQSAFSPEIVRAIQFAEEASLTAELISKWASLGRESKAAVSFAENQFQMNLFYIQRQFEEALDTLKLSRNYTLFIDGIDIRPSPVEYADYLECIKGLANAVWSVNTDFFANIKDSKGRMRVVLLIRPDIFDSLGLQNQNSKIRDNSVVLNWNTTYTEYRNSPLFLVTDRLLNYDQPETLSPGEAWDYYFPFDARNVRSEQEFPSSFIVALRYSLYRPRDILTMLSVLKENFVEQARDTTQVFSEQSFIDPAFTRKYSDYLLGEIKDQLLFYYSFKDYELFLKFFQFLDGQFEFTYGKYLEAYESYSQFIERNHLDRPPFCSTPDNFLQFLYNLNLVCYMTETSIADDPFFGWCFRDRTLSNIAPKVRTHAQYRIHYGLRKALDLGRRLYP
ncbi:MAG: P-loop ATPase, Sll1717 family [Candidatus Hodarchaeota archaeon]